MTARLLRRTEALGRRGEDAAAAYLRREGMRILARNWRCRHGELDIIAEHGGVLVAVEVKTRSSGRFGAPLEAVGPEKRARLRCLAIAWVRGGAPAAPLRVGAPRRTGLKVMPTGSPRSATSRFHRVARGVASLFTPGAQHGLHRRPLPRIRVDVVSVLAGADGRCYVNHHRGVG